MSAHPKSAVVVDGWSTLSCILHCKSTVVVGLIRVSLCADVYSEVPLRAIKAAAAQLGVCDFYFRDIRK